jgi:uncharacterized protein (TIGR02594 family)
MSVWKKLIAALSAKRNLNIPTAPTAVIAPDRLPPWIKELQKVIGLHEKIDRTKLSMWLKSDGETLGNPAKLPWCGDCVDTALQLGIPKEPRPGDLAKNPYWALNWLYFGKTSEPAVGAVLVFKRPSGGHVGFAVGQTKTHYAVLGGNQGDSICVVLIEKSRCVGVRWPSTYKGEKLPLPYSKVGIVSRNEA